MFLFVMLGFQVCFVWCCWFLKFCIRVGVFLILRFLELGCRGVIVYFRVWMWQFCFKCLGWVSLRMERNCGVLCGEGGFRYILIDDNRGYDNNNGFFWDFFLEQFIVCGQQFWVFGRGCRCWYVFVCYRVGSQQVGIGKGCQSRWIIGLFFVVVFWVCWFLECVVFGN